MPEIELFDIIATIESNNNFTAMRFELNVYTSIDIQFTRPNIKSLINRIKNIHKCSYATANMIYSTSWGAIQIMGFNIYNPNFKYQKSIVDFLNSEDDQRSLFDKFITSLNLNYSPVILAQDANKRDDFARYYNGSGNIEVYSSLIKASLQQHGFEVK